MKTPAVKRTSLILVSGIAWSAVGIFLIILASEWMLEIHRYIAILIAVGIAAGLVIYRFGFSRIAAVNLARIKALAPEKEKLCLFAFQNKRSYAIIAVMMPMGYALRHSPVPKIFLIPIYAAIGLGLFLSSLLYYQHFR